MKWLFFMGLVLLAACGGGDERPSRYPAREPGCNVAIFHGAPQGKTVNIGPVDASCSEDVPDTDCLRTLQDQVCKLGGDVVWGVDDKPKMDLGHKNFHGRAAHTRESAPASSGAASWSSSVTVIDGGM